ncbi:MAG: T9SS type A sorting domain-containing protein [Saprospiraceae bacterium]
MNQKIYLLCFFIVGMVCASVAQEQVSFAYDRQTTNYFYQKLYKHDGELRFFGAEKNGEITIVSTDGISQDTIFSLNESEVDVPYRQFLSEDKFAQFYETKIVIVDLLNLSAEVKTLATPTRYGYFYLQKDMLSYRSYQEAKTQVILFSDYTITEVPSEFSLAVNDKYMYRSVSASPMNYVMLCEIATGEVDTIYQSNLTARVKIEASKLYLEAGNSVYQFNPTTEQLQNIHDFETSNVMRSVSFYQEEVVFCENVGEETKLTFLDANTFTSETYNLSDTLYRPIRRIFLKDENGDFVFEDIQLRDFRTVGLTTAQPMPVEGNQVFVDEANDILRILHDDKILAYDFENDAYTVEDTILIGNSNYNYSYLDNLVEWNDEIYLQKYELILSRHAQMEGFRPAQMGISLPVGLSALLEFHTSTNELYLTETTKLYHLAEDTLQLVDSAFLISDLLQFQDEFYFNGYYKYNLGLYKMSGGEPSLVEAKGYNLAVTEDGEHLLARDHHFANGYSYKVFEPQQNDWLDLDFMPNDQFDVLAIADGANLYLETEENDTVTIWQLNLTSNTLTELFHCDNLIKGHPITDKIVFHVFDHEGFSKFIFLNLADNTIEHFKPHATSDYHMGIFQLNCEESLLFEVASLDCTELSIWSTDGTFANTKMQLENAAPVERGFGDFGFHSDETGLYFSVKNAPENFVHYQYDCASMSLTIEDYPADIVFARRFTVGETSFGISNKNPINERALIDFTDPSNVVYTSALSRYRNVLEIVGFARGYMYNVPESLGYGDEMRQLVVLNVEPFGQELYYVYADGTLELLADLHTGASDAFFTSANYFQFELVKTKVFQGRLYLDAYTRDFGHQIFSLPADGLVSTPAAIVEKPLQLTLFPNPTQANLRIELEGQTDFQWDIINLEGKVLRSGFEPSNAADLELANVPAGLYYCVIKVAGRKLIKAFSKL